MLNPQHIERLRTLYSILPGIPEANFNIMTWGRGRFEKNECGSSACALGWAAVHPEFTACGLKLHRGEIGASPRCGAHVGFNAAQAFFGLTWHESEFLFSFVSGQHPYDFQARHIACSMLPAKQQPIEVMSRIRQVLLHHGAITMERSDELVAQEAIMRKGGLKALMRAGKLEGQE